MRILAVMHRYPMYDRASGDLRFFQMLEILSRKHVVSFSCYGIRTQIKLFGEMETRRYQDALTSVGVKLEDIDPLRALRGNKFDAVLFEFYHSAYTFLGDGRLIQPDAINIVDSVDVHFNRLFAHSRVTNLIKDFQHAAEVKQMELEVYRKADLVIAVSSQDREILLSEDVRLQVGVAPNIHAIQSFDDGSQRLPDSLLFVGGFGHDPNIDAVLYLCREIMPLIWAQVPNAKLRIVGDSPPEVVRGLAEARVEVVGYVPDLAPYLRTSRVSVAPLRYGGGMKGKIGEAMAAGLPVVTTSIGGEGFGFTPGRELLIADSPIDFCSAVVRLLRDPMCYESIRRAGWEFIADHFSPQVVEAQLLGLFDRVASMPVRSLTPWERIKTVIPAPLRFVLRKLR